MNNKRFRFTTGLFSAAIGVIVLGADRIIASANSGPNYVQSLTTATVVGLVFLGLGAVFLFYKNK